MAGSPPYANSSHGMDQFFKFDGDSEWSIYIEDHRASKGWWADWQCDFVTFDPGVRKPPSQSSWKHKEWPVDRCQEELNKGGRREKRFYKCWEHSCLEKTVHSDRTATYTCNQEGHEEQDGDLTLFNKAFGLTQRDAYAETLATETIKVYLRLLNMHPPTSFWTFIEGIDPFETEIIDDASTYAAWLNAEAGGSVNWNIWLESAATNTANKNLIVEVLRKGYDADVVRLLDQNREGEATAEAVIRAKEQATKQLVARYIQELDERSWCGSQVDEVHKDGHVLYTHHHASINYLRVRF